MPGNSMEERNPRLREGTTTLRGAMVAIGSREYWRQRSSYPEDWATRAIIAGRLVSPGSRVLDIGCGPHMALAKHLPGGCTYTAADLTEWSEEVRRVDVDADLFPAGEFDCIVLLGVIEYLARPQNVFRYARTTATAMVVSYTHPVGIPALEPRRQSGWINAYSESEFAAIAAEGNWHIARSEIFHLSPITRHIVHALVQMARDGHVERATSS